MYREMQRAIDGCKHLSPGSFSRRSGDHQHLFFVGKNIYAVFYQGHSYYAGHSNTGYFNSEIRLHPTVEKHRLHFPMWLSEKIDPDWEVRIKAPKSERQVALLLDYLYSLDRKVGDKLPERELEMAEEERKKAAAKAEEDRRWGIHRAAMDLFAACEALVEAGQNWWGEEQQQNPALRRALELATLAVVKAKEERK